MEKRLKIGLVGPSSLLSKIRTISEEFPDVSFFSFEYSRPLEAPQIVRDNQDFLDAIFFCGHIPYCLSLNSVARTKPWGYLPLCSRGLLVALLSARGHISSRFRMSVDTLTEKEVRDELEECDINIDVIYAHSEGMFRFSTSDLVSFHSSLAQEGKTDFCITCVEAVNADLNHKGIPSYLVAPNKQFIRDSLEKLVLEVRGRSNEHLLSVVGVFRPDNKSKSRRWYEKSMLALNTHLVDYAKKRGILVIPRDISSFETIETMGQFLIGTTNLTDCSFISKLRKACNFDVSIGFGVGPSLSIAEENAMEALDLAGDGKNNCYLFDGKEAKVLGDQGMPTLRFAFPAPEISSLSERLGITISTLSRYLHGLTCFEGSFTATDFAKLLGIQPKSSRKVINNLLREELIEEEGTLYRSGRGRPQRLYVVTEKFSQLQK